MDKKEDIIVQLPSSFVNAAESNMNQCPQRQAGG
jgi:hypothetical protein